MQAYDLLPLSARYAIMCPAGCDVTPLSESEDYSLVDTGSSSSSHPGMYGFKEKGTTMVYYHSSLPISSLLNSRLVKFGDENPSTNPLVQLAGQAGEHRKSCQLTQMSKQWCHAFNLQTCSRQWIQLPPMAHLLHASLTGLDPSFHPASSRHFRHLQSRSSLL
jgi:hypothetical protein